ncbi:MAG: hypothetical protein R3D25_18625 [Geminicoccaceae bacterium]
MASAPLILRDGRQATANVLHVAFAPNATSLSSETRSSVEQLLRPVDASCVLSAQVVGVASERETAPRLVVDAHVLARDRADGIARLIRDAGVPAEDVASVWTVENDGRPPMTAVWLFMDGDTPTCAEPLQPLVMAAEAAPLPVLASAEVDAPEIRTPIPRRPSHLSARLPSERTVSPAAGAATIEPLTLTFADNSSYLSAGDSTRLRRFAVALDRPCRLVLTATVAGGDIDTEYAAWLAQRRLDRVAAMLRDLVAEGVQLEYALQPSDARRQVSLAVPAGERCSAEQPVVLAHDYQPR